MGRLAFYAKYSSLLSPHTIFRENIVLARKRKCNICIATQEAFRHRMDEKKFVEALENLSNHC